MTANVRYNVSMEKDALAFAVNEGLSIRKLGERFDKSYTTMRYWLHKYRLKTQRPIPRVRNAACTICERPTGDGRLRCAGCWTKLRRYTCKVIAIELLGGCCVKCGWVGEIGGFTFHHIRGQIDKSFEIGRIANKSWDVVKEELKKCELLCSNCHHIEHSNYKNKRFLKEAAEMLCRRRARAGLAQR